MRAAGILLPVTSLPSPYGIGTLGQAAFDFVDFLARAGQTYWQVLPVGPTGYCDSPYQSFSAFAGNPYLIDLDLLCEEELLFPDEIGAGWGSNPARADYGLLYIKRFKVLEKAAARLNKAEAEYTAFCEENAWWLDDYALFMALKEAQGDCCFSVWPKDLRRRTPDAMKRALAQHGARAEFWKSLQFFFFRQWKSLKKYANSKGVFIIGDIPIYVSPDSSDLWANPRLFKVDGEGQPTFVAGVPPDGFSADGQLWGNPLYDWMYHQRTKYNWWIQRMRAAGEMYDIVRIDHFRGFAGYYAVAAGEANAKSGRWLQGPGRDFVRAIRRALPGLKVIAEDLGVLTPDVYALMEYSGYPGMKVLQFAFNPDASSEYLPHNYGRNTVVYTGTHDNMTSAQWAAQASPAEVGFAMEYLACSDEDHLCTAFVRAALASVAGTAIIPLQDWMCLGAEARINTPATVGGNWDWRLEKDALGQELEDTMYGWSRMYSRLGAAYPARDMGKRQRQRTSVVSVQEMKDAERQAQQRGVNAAQLMENAGNEAAAWLMRHETGAGKGKSALMLCGKGNNAGDAYVMARSLHGEGWDITILPVFSSGEGVSPLARENMERLPAEIKTTDASQADFKAPYIVDAVFGTGYRGSLPKQAQECFEKANRARGCRIALDVPSGIDADTGEAYDGCFDAAHTLSLGMHKHGAVRSRGRSPVGRLHLLDIGL